mmetsp:Transcript_64357/g.178871  ORF Transcript_64357/g.178871 Transcript_64357/m.178871 type:complete len:169 (+) Transcript_64357:105-611(+)
MGQLSPTVQAPSQEDRWRYCCHLEGEVPIELQLASARSQHQEVNQQPALRSSTSPWPHLPLPPGHVKTMPAILPKRQLMAGRIQCEEVDHFPEVVRSSPHRRPHARTSPPSCEPGKQGEQGALSGTLCVTSKKEESGTACSGRSAADSERDDEEKEGETERTEDASST